MKLAGLIIICMLGMPEIFYGQSLYDAKGNVIATKISENRLNVTGSVFAMENGRMINILDGQRREDLGVNYSLREGGRIHYFNTHDEFTGYYIPSENRFYRVDAKRGEDNHIALLYEGQVYTLNENPTFKIDNGFDPELIGYVLFFFLGY
ncbi:MAG: hypothetical protein LBV72_15535 [Tannerella sp.]|jgi:hypothetical protein|nr:hypothetical protein [Tannerella sp.]